MAWRTSLATARALAPGKGKINICAGVMAAHPGKIAVTLLAQLHPGDIPDADDLSRFRPGGS